MPTQSPRPVPAVPPQFKWRKNGAELKVWAYLWASATSAHWDFSEAITVARYVELVAGKGKFSLGAGRVSDNQPFRIQPAMLAEIRNLEDRLALSVKTRQALGLVNEQPEPETDEAAPVSEIEEARAARNKRFASG